MIDARGWEAHGRSDRTQLALVAGRLPTAARSRVEGLLQRGEVGVVHGLAEGLRFPARAVGGVHAQSRLLLLGDLEVPVQEALRRTVPAGGTVWDVGANLGFFAVLAARLAGEGGRVVAFEPVPGTAALAAEAAARSGLDGAVEVRAQALGGSAGREALHVVGEAGWSHLASRGRHDATTETIEVEVVTADGLLEAGAPAPDVVKLDVEGSEADVLRGAHRLLREHRPALVIELHETRDEVLGLLDDAGYAAEVLDAAVPAGEAAPDAHLLARPRP